MRPRLDHRSVVYGFWLTWIPKWRTRVRVLRAFDLSYQHTGSSKRHSGSLTQPHTQFASDSNSILPKVSLSRSSSVFTLSHPITAHLHRLTTTSSSSSLNLWFALYFLYRLSSTPANLTIQVYLLIGLTGRGRRFNGVTNWSWGL
jgi:hypothetical protein